MKQVTVYKIAADLVLAGKTNDEVRKALFNTKGVKVNQIRLAMALLSE
jgi:hypothetical protein